MTRQLCAEEHVFGPATRSAWLAWAADRSRTHRQFDCPDCRLPVIWRPIDAEVDAGQLDLFGSQA